MLFGNKKKKNTPTIVREENISSNSAKVILQKAEDGLNHQIVSLKKEKNIDLFNHKARIFVVLDRSGSMNSLYRNGSIQNTLTRLLPLALKFDDNGELDVYLFNTSYIQLPSMTIKNYENYVNEQILKKGYAPSGGTSYSPVINKTISDYTDNSDLPAFGIFITDGENNDYSETDAAIRISSRHKIFYKFIGMGNENFKYLRKLDNLSGRTVDNTAFCKVSSFDTLNDEQLYNKLLEQYPDWLKAMQIN